MILSALLGKVAAGDKDHLQLQQEISRVSGGISVSNHFFYDKNEELKGKTTLTSKFLPENTTDTTNLMFEVLNKTDFSHHERIKELMFQNFMGFQQSIVENGHRFAMLGASASHNKLSHVQESLGGLSAISKFAPFVTQQDELMKTEIEKVEGMYKKFESMKSELLFISNNKLSKDQINAIRAIDFKKDGSSKVDIEFTKTFNKVAFPINTQVNFSAMSLDAPLYDVKDSPKFLILSSLMRNEFLHKRVREQGGAYGGGASYDPFTGTFKFFSYRDPRFIETIEDFQSALSWASLGSFDDDMILESKLSVLSDIDKPSSPAGEAFKDYRLSGEGKTQKMREEYRKNIFSVSKDDLVEAANGLKNKPLS